MPKPPKPEPVEVEVRGIVAYSTYEETIYRRQDFARFVFLVGGAARMARAHIIVVPKMPSDWSPEAARQAREWLRKELPLRLYPGGRLQYESMEDQCRVLMGQ